MINTASQMFPDSLSSSLRSLSFLLFEQTSSYESLTLISLLLARCRRREAQCHPSWATLPNGELGCYGGGISRGAPTPRLDKLAVEGLRRANFKVFPTREN